MKRIGIVIGAFVCVVIAFLFVRDLLKSEEDRVREVIDGAVDAVESGGVFALDDYLALSYRDRWGLDRQRARQALVWLRRQFAEIRVDYSDVAIEIEGDNAVAQFAAALEFRRQKDGEWVPGEEALKGMGLSADLRDRRFKVKLIREDGEWKINWAGRPDDPSGVAPVPVLWVRAARFKRCREACERNVGSVTLASGGSPPARHSGHLNET